MTLAPFSRHRPLGSPLVVNARVFDSPLHAAGEPPQVRVSLEIQNFPWQNATLTEFSLLIAKLRNIEVMAKENQLVANADAGEPE